MTKIIRSLPLFALVAVLGLAGGCSPEIGSKEWCDAMKEKPKGNWTADEAAAFAKSCVF